jgi:16S rRNA (cytidine1402-2'-O)-methyltransferase
MLLVCATPIGNLGDVTPRVLDALRAADLIAAEDTRHTRKLLAHFDIHTPMTSFFAHNEAQRTEQVLGLLRGGKTVALVTDAGMPGVSDPGARLVARAVVADLPLTVLPGPSAVVTALVLSGLAGDAGFRFVGYLPRRARELERALSAWRACGGIVVAFETGQRLARSLAVLAAYLPEARAAACRELTKVHEEVARGTLLELSGRYPVAGPDATPAQSAVRGEVTLVLDLGAARDEAAPEPAQVTRMAEGLLARGLSRRDAAAALHVCLGLPRRDAERVARETAAGRRDG